MVSTLWRGEGDEFVRAGLGRAFGRCAVDGGVCACGQIEVDRAGAEGDVGVIERVGVVSVVGKENVVERGGGAMGVVVTVEGDFSAA